MHRGLLYSAYAKSIKETQMGLNEKASTNVLVEAFIFCPFEDLFIGFYLLVFVVGMVVLLIQSIISVVFFVSHYETLYQESQ